MRESIVSSIYNLREEKAALEEEVRQLRAAVQLYAEVARRLEMDTSPRRGGSAGPRLVAAA